MNRWLEGDSMKELSQSPLVELAVRAVREYITRGQIINPPSPLPPEMQKAAGVFVSIKKHNRLRGCIGTYHPTEPNIAQEIIRNAIYAATEDPRFLPVEPEEFDELTFSVDVLSPPEPVEGLSQLDPKKYGVIVEKGRRRGLLLPDLEGVDTVEEQIAITCQKAGIDPEEDFQIYRFTVNRYK